MRRRIAQRTNAVTLAELRRLLEAYGWELDRVRGSHHIFAREQQTVSIPYRRPHLRATYVRQALKLTEGEDDDDSS